MYSVATHPVFVQFTSLCVQWDNFFKPKILQMGRFYLPNCMVIYLIQWWFLFLHKKNIEQENVTHAL